MVRIYIGFLFIALLGIGVIFKAAHTQLYDARHLIAESDSVTIFSRTVAAERGNIYSQDGKLLATSLPIFDVHIDFDADGLNDDVFSPANVDSVCDLLAAKYHDRSAGDYRKDFSKAYKKGDTYYLLHKNISLADLNEMKTWPWFRLSRNRSGLIIENKELRGHPFGDIALHTLGEDEHHDGIYTSGIELKYDKELAGEKVKKFYRKLSGGASKPLDTKDEPVNTGKDIYTTIDINIQDVAEDALRNALAAHDADHGCVVLMETKTGKIKAIANLGRKDSANYREYKNYAVGEATVPGSTMKLATAASLMEDGMADITTPVYCGNGILEMPHGARIRDDETPETHTLTLKRAIEVSSNVAMATFAHDHYIKEPDKFYAHLKAFGFTEPVRIEVDGAAQPVLKETKNWSGVSAMYIAHGYELGITPMHTLQFYNTIANNGVMVKPTLIEKIREYNQTVDSNTTVVLNPKTMSDKTVKQLREILEGVVENGTGQMLKTTYLKIAGKTGTAVISKPGSPDKKYQAAFVGYFPADDPQYTMIVVINSPTKGGYYGNKVAGTVFREVADKVYSLSLDMHPIVNTGISQNILPVIESGSREDIGTMMRLFGANIPDENNEWIKLTAGDSRKYIANDIKADIVPDVVGMGLKDAVYLLESRGLHVQFTGRGNVKGQSIDAGTKVSKGQKITIELS